MKTVEQLSQQVGVHIVISLEASQELVQRKLEALCNAYMQDRLESLNLSIVVHQVDSPYYTCMVKDLADLPEGTKLYDISTLKDKP